MDTLIVILGVLGIIMSYGFGIAYLTRVIIRRKNREKTRKKYFDRFLKRREKRYKDFIRRTDNG